MEVMGDKKMTEESEEIINARRTSKVVAIVLGGIGGILTNEVFIIRSNYIPRTDKAANGYAIPSRLEIQLRDLDGDGMKETILNYDGKSYLLRLDANGKPVISSYETRPSQVVPSEK